MQTLDHVILGVYLVGLVGIGVALARRAGRSGEDYFLGGRRIPWWALGASGMSSNLDVAGTVTIIALLYTYGLQGFWIETRGGVVLPIAVWLAFMGKWHRRSRVMTTAQWMTLRFGRGAAGRAARYVAAGTYLVITVAMVVFFLTAAARFIAQFVPAVDPATAAVLMAAVALGYTMVSGLHGVVWTDVFQAFLIGAAAVFVSVKAFAVMGPEVAAAWPGAATNTAWPQPSLTDETYGSAFWLFLLFFAGKGLLEGLGGSGGSAYMAQRYYAAASDADTHKLSALWAVLFTFRWPMVTGLAVLAIHHGVGQDDPETILSTLLLDDAVFPTGLRGLVVAALFAASMSTFDSTINAGASYVVKDLYAPLVHPSVPDEAEVPGEVTAGYVASAVIVALGLVLTLTLGLGTDILGIWTTIVVGLFPAFLVSFALRWFWGRFNGWGFVAGIVAGFGLALLQGFGVLSLNEWQNIAVLAGGSLVVAVLVTLLTPAVPEARLRGFFEQVRPWGLWPMGWRAAGAWREEAGDMVRLGVSVVWQVTMFLVPMLLVLREFGQAAGTAAIWAVCSAYLFVDVRRQGRREVQEATP